MARRVRLLVPLFLVTALLFAFSARVAADSATEKAVPPPDPADIGITRLVAIITAIGALGMAAFSLVDATKAFGGGVSNVGLPGLNRVVGSLLGRARAGPRQGREGPTRVAPGGSFALDQRSTPRRAESDREVTDTASGSRRTPRPRSRRPVR